MRYVVKPEQFKTISFGELREFVDKLRGEDIDDRTEVKVRASFGGKLIEISADRVKLAEPRTME